MRVLILGLGNDFLRDDGVGLHAARMLRMDLPFHVDVMESSEAGMGLLDLLIGYDRVILLDAIHTGHHLPGTIQEMSLADLGPVLAPSPHYAGLPELAAVAREMDLQFPESVKVYAIEVEDPYSIGSSLSVSVEKSLPELVALVKAQLKQWIDI